MEINDLTHTILAAHTRFTTSLALVFLERVYENALQIELQKLGITVLQQQELKVWYEGQIVGDYKPDLWIPEKLIIEIKSVQNLAKEHEVKLIHYLAATKIDDGLLINFGQSVQVKRKFREYKPKGKLLDVIR
ncbi:MAG: GxxExxY protein [Blastocatellia bacterium]|nr:MAG: GxxExxY protein [Blastocatellia bacterium]